MAKRTGLGRGIGALIPTGTEARERPADVFFAGSPALEEEAPAAPEAPKRRPAAKKAPAAESPAEVPLTEVPGVRLVHVDPHAIVPNPRQPRTLFDAEDLAELVHSVREFGVLQPVVVRDKKDGTYELIMGERRTRASREAGLAEIPAIVRETADEDLLRDALLENIHRAQLNALEEASAYQQLINDFGITQEQLADRIGRSRPQISNTIRLLRLPESVQQRVAAGVLSAGHARAILSLDGDADGMQRLADKIVNEELTVRGAETAAKVIQAAGTSAPAAPKRPQAGARRAYLDEVSDKLGDRLNTKVKIDLTARKGQIKISFATIQDLNRILEELGESGYEQ
ncbi:ParB/RepB/Spo0J family partition protein [Microbacterium excoecariae]|uniref:ParB/RepB/Spo0J family partition protein n=1 Tax=Microbacterium excoecariae TaxID=2715210 RepID=UPI00140CD46D|nr:ParB/RepB/Spo0J family partition protein [Microbacterium excoecariae]NHI15878.1 ParB/RepB/Spo0J family partition protein [Microbacterium excoecariae]